MTHHLRVTPVCATLLWAGTVLATPTAQQQCDFARITAWKVYTSCVDTAVAKNAKGVSFDQFKALWKCRHAYFKKWTAFQSNASLATSTCQPAGGGRFLDNGDGTVNDNLSGLVWEKKTANVTEYPIPTANSDPSSITAGPDGNLWFTEAQSNQIGKVTTAGVFTEYPIPTANSDPSSITAGPDGNLWFTEAQSNQIGKVTTAGVFTEYPASYFPYAITAGPDGNLWFIGGQRIGNVTTTGVITEYLIPTVGSDPSGITAGPDGNLWFTERSGNNIWKVTTAGMFTEYPIPTANSQPYAITAGPDGNLWFTERSGNNIGKVTTAGMFTEYPIPTANSQPYAITAGPDGNLWFTEGESGTSPVPKIGVVTTSGSFTEYPILTPYSFLDAITAGPDGNLWFTVGSDYSNNVGRIPPSAAVSIHDAGNFYTWSTGSPFAENGTAFTTFLTGAVTGLNVAGFAGANGWRLPRLAELQSILADFPCTGVGDSPTCICTSSPCIGFNDPNTESDFYWSATSWLPGPHFAEPWAWLVTFSDGNVLTDAEIGGHPVRAVRGGL